MPFKDLEKKREYRKEWYKKNKKKEKIQVKKRKNEINKWFKNYKKGLSCSICGENHPATLEFHHYKKNKEFEIGKMVSEGYSKKKITDEIQKCLILCANCHRKEHFKKENL